jgi:predicted small integral membrane protein
MVGTMVLIRLAKVAMIGSLAAYAFIVAYDNVVDYGSNYEFVRHVLSMDTTFPGNALMHRAITNESVWRVAYALIIAMEGLTALLLALGAAMLLGRLRAPAKVFNRSKVWAVAGLTVGFALWFLGRRWRILRDVAVEGMERPGGRVPHHHSDPCSADFCQPAGRRRCLTDLCCRRVADNAGNWDASIYCGAFILRLCPLLGGKADMAIALRNVRL